MLAKWSHCIQWFECEYSQSDIIFESHLTHFRFSLPHIQVPGEGSHKIVEYMRHLKNSENYSKNFKHCIFSGDTDFLMLGLAVNEIYVSLLQNVILNFCP